MSGDRHADGDGQAEPESLAKTVLYMWYYAIQATIVPGFILWVLAWNGITAVDAAMMAFIALFASEFKRVSPGWMIND